MRYELQENQRYYSVSVEQSFTLIDYLLLFVSALATVVFALFSIIFFGALFVKLFTHYEYEFDKDRYELTQYLRVFSYIRIKRYIIPFQQIKMILLTNADSGKALGEQGFLTKEWFTLEVISEEKVIRICRVEADELEDLRDLYDELKERFGDWFNFDFRFVQIN